MATSTIVLFITVLVSICHQIAGQYGNEPFPPTGRYRDPTVLKYFHRICQEARCGFEQVCERSRFQGSPRLYTCVQTPGGSMKQGDCPHRNFIQGTQIECNTDYGCRRFSDICCHGVGTSRCMRPRRSGSNNNNNRGY
ncbi:uncharacterized protein LOC110457935 [Mizuhopecten yessoensis]|uniref:Uncharacterized protein n=1 Tax=Mizuhopecten yessoensis TaxID=6573 RepID=A0A210R3F8_MIZYE|nr:uncharacterized protein LOC110457935 [Mizuhopecten yessoensis]OWF55593.1 hypothetical protein KP79_PYT11313 [Mizuhopecten yessoensis]